MSLTFPIIEQAFINNQWVDSNQRLDVLNPATKNAIGSIPNLDSSSITAAIDAAETALASWKKVAPIERANLLLQWHDLILQNIQPLAQLLSLECGKSQKEACAEVAYGASFIRWFAEEARRIYGDLIPADQANKHYLVSKQAIGIVGAITPWNFPNAMVTRKCAPALAAGCSVVLKPSELTPFSALALAQLAEKAGFPPGLFNVVTGDAALIGQILSQDPRVRKISFTGSTRVGKLLIEQSAKTVKKLSLELGGNAPFLIFSDANLDSAVENLIGSKFRNNGQTCVSANRVLIHQSVYDTFLQKLIPAVQALKVGQAFCDTSVDLGPLINQFAVDKVQALVDDALCKGARCALGGSALPQLGGYFFEPTILTNIKNNMQIADEEIFGPVIAIQIFDNDAEAIEMANASQAGLAAYIFTENAARLWNLSEVLQYGMIAANTAAFTDTLAPFGGIKYSGYGREGSKYGIEEYLDIKYMCWQTTAYP
jgi:succinate-semialdehyde dehydrogenase/glutarate-semialdehyde dehydrogenase